MTLYIKKNNPGMFLQKVSDGNFLNCFQLSKECISMHCDVQCEEKCVNM